MVLHQHEAAEFWAEMAVDPFRQRRQDRTSIGRHPALAPVTGGGGRDHEVLHQERLIAFEARPFRDYDFHHLIRNDDPGRHLAAEPPLLLLARLRRLRRIVHAARLDAGTALQAFQPGDLLALCGNDLFQFGDFTN
jgi:hypothetical protein